MSEKQEYQPVRVKRADCYYVRAVSTWQQDVMAMHSEGKKYMVDGNLVWSADGPHGTLITTARYIED